MSANMMNGGQRQQQQQQQQQHIADPGDTETIRRNYKAALSGLTFNSKPIITNLTIMAQENQGAASIIVREIENQLRNNAPGQKLPVLYLIDSICKNVGGPFITNFARNMVTVFLDAYTLTDTGVRERFERLLQTWKNGMPGGNPVFPRHIVESIERSIIYIREKNQPSRYTNSNTSTKAIHVNPNFVNKDVRGNSRDPRNRGPPVKTEKPALSSANLLSQLQTLLPSTQTNNLSNNDPVSLIISQIKAILPTLPVAQASSIEQYLSQIASPSLPSATISTPPPTLSYPRNNTLQQQISPVLPSVSVNQKVDTADLLKSLTSMGYLSPSPPIVKLDENTETHNSRVGLFLLDSKDLQINRPGAIELLYSAEPLQCKQCGFRYPKTEKGQAKMDAHLDSHFRQNRKMKDRVKRGLSRSFFVTVDQWVSGEGGELTSQQAPAFLNDGMGQVNKKSAEKNTQPNEDVINPDSYTVIMPNDDMRKPCLVCGERFIDFWNDDEEEWMYKNAIMVEDKIYHATCHADAVKSGNMADVDTEMLDESNNSDLKRKLDDIAGHISKVPRLE